jgi:hypothetical protein
MCGSYVDVSCLKFTTHLCRQMSGKVLEIDCDIVFFNLFQLTVNILSRDRVTINGVWTGNWIYWTLTDLTISNCSAIANSQTLQITTARTESSQSAVSSPVCLVTAYNDVASSPTVFMPYWAATLSLLGVATQRLTTMALLRSPRLHQGRLPHNSFFHILNCLPLTIIMKQHFGVATTLQTSMLEVFGSNLPRNTGYIEYNIFFIFSSTQ